VRGLLFDGAREIVEYGGVSEEKGRAAVGYDHGYDTEVFYLGLALIPKYVEGFVERVPGEDRQGLPRWRSPPTGPMGGGGDRRGAGGTQERVRDQGGSTFGVVTRAYPQAMTTKHE
jgi:hypothetical protein